MKKLVAFLFSISATFFCNAQSVFYLSDPGSSAVLLDSGWTYHMGDEPHASELDFDDANWKAIYPAGDIVDSIPADAKAGVGWMRLRFKVSEYAHMNKLTVLIRQSVASEIYLNGERIATYGTVSSNPSEIIAEDPRYSPLQLNISGDSTQILAVRFAVQPGVRYSTYYGTVNPFFSLMVMHNKVATQKYNGVYRRPWMDLFMQGIIFMVFVLHISFFIMLPGQRANLLFALSALFVVLGSFQHNYFYYGAPLSEKFTFAVLVSVFNAISQVLMFSSIHNYLKIRARTLFWLLIIINVFSIIIAALWYRKGFAFVLGYAPLVCFSFIIYVANVARRNKVREANILLIGFSIAPVAFLIFLFNAIFRELTDHLLIPAFNIWAFFFLIYLLSPPTAVSIFLAYDFARTGKRLQDKLNEVEILSEKNVAVEREKQELLATQNQQLETKVRERTAALNQSIDELKSTQKQLVQSEKMASLGELTAGIAHEIQNPLNFVNNFSEVSNELLEEMKDEIQKGNHKEVQAMTDNLKQNLEKILHHGKRADGIVKGMLQHSRSSSGVMEPTNINALADEYLRLAYHGFRAKDKSFNAATNTDLDKSIEKINVVPQEIGRVVLNLITNAFYAVTQKQNQNSSGYQPAVSVITKRSDGFVSISVKDNGNGIPQHLIEKIFQPFFTTKPTGEGTGLGLSLSYDIVKAHGGELTVATIEGEGSEFMVRLPA